MNISNSTEEYYLIKFLVINEIGKVNDETCTFAVINYSQLSIFKESTEYVVDTDKGIRYLQYVNSYSYDGTDDMKKYINSHQSAELLIRTINEDY
jgi:hypothetical protein